jgi:hypothetical protein
MNNHYWMNENYKKAESYLRENELNTITWEHFTGDFNSVINYLEKIANHIWKIFEIDETEVFTEIQPISSFNGWDEKYLPSKQQMKGHTHLMFYGAYDWEGGQDVKVLTVQDLQDIEARLHHAIVEGLNNIN